MFNGLSMTFNPVLAALMSARIVPSFNPLTLFAAGEPGVWYDPSDLSTLFQDAAGTTPVTAVEQPVGLMLDKSKGLVLGPELVTNGTFNTDISGWAASGSSPVISWQNGRLQVSGGGNAWASTSFSVEIGKRYQITLDVFGGAYTARFVIGPTSSTGNYYSEVLGGITGDRQASATFVPTQNIAYILLMSPTGAAVQFDNISVRELPGNHARQTTATSRPVLSARYNLLTKTEQFDDAVWEKVGAAVAANTSIAVDGTLSADRLIENTSTGPHAVQSAAFAEVAGQQYTFSVYVQAAGRTVVALGQGGVSTGVWFNLATGTVVKQESNVTSASITDVGNGIFRLVSTVTRPINGNFNRGIYLAATNGSTSYTGDGTSGIYIWGASLVPADQAHLPYQRINTATDYDTAGFPHYLRFDGVDDWLVTNTITPGTDKVQVFAGVRKLSDAASVIAELSTASNSNQGSFLMAHNGTGAPNGYNIISRGTWGPDFGANGYAAPVTNVLTGLGDISGDSGTLRVNGTQAAISTADQGTGNYLAYPLYIGRRAGTSLPFNGHIYSLIVRFGNNLPIETIENTEKYVGIKTGVTL